MPFYDLGCPNCQRAEVDVLLRVADVKACEQCGTSMVRVWAGKGANVIGDETDVWQENGFHTPQHFRSKAERARALLEKGLDPHYSRHVTLPGTDKSSQTTDWSKGSMDPQTLRNAEILAGRPAEPKMARVPDSPIIGIEFPDGSIDVRFTVREVPT